ncbi:MAG: Na/Pi cotransporter family protein [Clostridia bacterium]|nr:Na/Pi cotransporter family protein [Clostridia bacterium]
MTTSDILTIINALFFILGGVVVFMVGMNMMGSNLEKAAGKGMRRLMTSATKNKALGITTGAAVTAIVNSSSATTVMIVGFVNVGIMTLTQAASIIMGANIGTTISAFIMALSSTGSALEISAIFALLAFCGMLVNMLAKTDRTKRIGNIFVGVGLIFIGLNVMSTAVNSLLDGDTAVSQAIQNLFISLGNGKDVLTWEVIVLFLLGAALTALLQSSAAITAICITLAVSGQVSTQMVMCIILGTNVGTCATSMLSSIGASTPAKRAAMIHLLFNIIGSLIFIWPVAFAGNYIAQALAWITPKVQWQIPIFHMFFNVVVTLILVGFTKYLVKLACLMIPEKKGKKPETAEEGEMVLDSRLLKTPAIAVGQARRELVKMGDLAFSNYKRAIDMLLEGDLSKEDDFRETEEKVTELKDYISTFLVKLSGQEISDTDEKKVGTFYNVATDMERIGAYAENITEFAQQMQSVEGEFSEHALDEIKETHSYICELYEVAEKAFMDRDTSLYDKVDAAESEVNRMNKVMHTAHLRRVSEGRCTADVGAIYLQLATTLERIGDHMVNIAYSLKSYT